MQGLTIFTKRLCLGNWTVKLRCKEAPLLEMNPSVANGITTR